MKEKATELEWLIWFFQNANFGPADSDVRAWMKQRFMEMSGKELPDGYNET